MRIPTWVLENCRSGSDDGPLSPSSVNNRLFCKSYVRLFKKIIEKKQKKKYIYIYIYIKIPFNLVHFRLSNLGMVDSFLSLSKPNGAVRVSWRDNVADQLDENDRDNTYFFSLLAGQSATNRRGLIVLTLARQKFLSSLDETNGTMSFEWLQSVVFLFFYLFSAPKISFLLSIFCCNGLHTKTQ
jgi:hypothetical protein